MKLIYGDNLVKLLITAIEQISSSVHHWGFLSFSFQGEYKVQRQAVWTVTNLTAGGTIEQIIKVVAAGALKPLCDLLVVKETKIVTMILDALINILNVSTAMHTQYLLRRNKNYSYTPRCNIKDLHNNYSKVWFQGFNCWTRLSKQFNLINVLKMRRVMQV